MSDLLNILLGISELFIDTQHTLLKDFLSNL